MNPIRYLVLLLVLLIFIPGCGSNEKGSAVIIGIPYDPESLNPLYAFSGYEIGITEILYPSLVKLNWDESRGDIRVSLLMAEKVEWTKDSTSVRVTLIRNIFWSDNIEVTSDDIIFSFDLYSDPAVQSRLYGTFNDFITDDSLRILPESFKKENSYTFTINFRENSNPSLLDLDLPLLPEHIYGKLQRDKIPYLEKEIKPVTCGSYLIKSWERNQSIILSKNSNSFLVKKESPAEIIFKIVPDYNSRLTQLKNGEIDLADDIKTEDVKELETREDLAIDRVEGREYDYIGWNNIDPELYKTKKTESANKLFGDSQVRKALTLAVNRFEIMDEYLLNYGEVASSPLSPIFREAVDKNIKPYPYNPGLAADLVKAAGWYDKNEDGVLEKGNQEFAFTLNIPSGNPRRDFAASLIKNNLKQIGVNVSIEPMEPAVFFEKMFKRELSAWIAGWSIPIPQELRGYWYSKLDQAPFNVAGYRSTKADAVIDKIVKEKDEAQKNNLYLEFHRILYDECPVTFLYWIDNIVIYNKRIKNAEITPLGAIHNIWEWELDE